MSDNLGDRMKAYEEAESGRRFMPLLPVCARLDGRSFSAYTRGMARPYDEVMTHAMEFVTEYLVKETCALIGYTQSDEISLVWCSDDYKSQIFFDGRIQKMTSVLAAMCSVQFYQVASVVWPKKGCSPVAFDCRVWQVPTKEEAANQLLWRELDASKNSVSAAARSVYSHKELQGKTCSEMQELLHQKGINWNNYPSHFKRGMFFQRRVVSRRFTPEELGALPERHEARSNPDLVIERSDVVKLEMPPFSKVVNRVGVIFAGEEPRVDGTV